LRGLTLELVKALEGITREAITGRAAIRAFRKRKDILSEMIALKITQEVSIEVSESLCLAKYFLK